MNIPSKNDCFRLMCETQMLENIVAHSLQVCRVGMCLVDYLKVQGDALDARLVQAAALLERVAAAREIYEEFKRTAKAESALRNTIP